jgi:hypothetical protein
MPYLLLIREHGTRDRWSDAEARQAHDKMMGFANALKARGLCAAAESLRPDTEGVRVEVRGGKRIVVEGPFAESREMVGGFFLLTCESQKEALAIASECPAVEWATVEVREVAPCWPHRRPA